MEIPLKSQDLSNKYKYNLVASLKKKQLPAEVGTRLSQQTVMPRQNPGDVHNEFSSYS